MSIHYASLARPRTEDRRVYLGGSSPADHRAATLAYARQATVLVSVALCSSAALGQDELGQDETAAKGTSLEEIVVTAQKRSENLQDVPVAITALTADTMQSQGIQKADDLNIATPGLNVARSVRSPVIFMRGVGTFATSPGQEQNVAIYVDGVYYAAMVGSGFRFNNIDHLEVLKGPQGTLFGRNTTGGLIHIITKDPSKTPAAKVSVGYGNYDTKEANGYFAAGLTDSLSADLAVLWSEQTEGWGRNIFTGNPVDLDEQLNVRSKWVFEPSDDTKFTLTAGYGKSESDIGDSAQISPLPAGVAQLPPLYGSIRFNGNIYDSNADTSIFDITKQKTASLRFEQELGFARLVNIAGWMDTRNHSLLDLDRTPVNVQRGEFNPDRTRTFSEEIQLLSNASSPIQWIAGLFYFHSNALLNLRISGLAFATSGQYRQISDVSRTDSYSAFGQVTIPLFTDATKLTLGARYTLDQKSIEGGISSAAGVLASVPPGTEEEFKNPTYRVALNHNFTDDVMAYVSVSTGFKSGLYNSVSPTSPVVDPEKLTDYELGVKTELLDQRVRLNVASFYYDYKDMQLSRFVGTSLILQNASTAKIYGLEAEIAAAVTDTLQLRGGLAVQHSEYTSFPNSSANVDTPLDCVAGDPRATCTPDGIASTVLVDATGNTLQRAPDHTFNLGFDYGQPTSAGTFGIGATYYRNGGFFWEPDNVIKQQAYSLVNAELSWIAPGEGYCVRLWGKNLAGEEYYSYGTTTNGGPNSGSPGAPRMYGISFEARFGNARR